MSDQEHACGCGGACGPCADASPAPDGDDFITYLGGSIKALGDGRIGGCAVRFGSPEDHDPQGDFFTKATYFGRGREVDLYYHHNLPRRGDPLGLRLRDREIGHGEVKAADDGLYVEGTLDLSDPDVAALYRDVEAGKVGFSSGSDRRLVKRTPVKAGVFRVDRWPMNEISLTYTPVEKRNRAVALKALLDDDDASHDPAPVAGVTIVHRSERLVADARELLGHAEKAARLRAEAGRHLSPDKRDAIKALADALAELHARTAPPPSRVRPDAEAVARLNRRLMDLRVAALQPDQRT